VSRKKNPNIVLQQSTIYMNRFKTSNILQKAGETGTSIATSELQLAAANRIQQQKPAAEESPARSTAVSQRTAKASH
jgi:hypothetical protein